MPAKAVLVGMGVGSPVVGVGVPANGVLVGTGVAGVAVGAGAVGVGVTGAGVGVAVIGVDPNCGVGVAAGGVPVTADVGVGVVGIGVDSGGVAAGVAPKGVNVEVGVGENCPFPFGSVGDFESQPGRNEHRSPIASTTDTTVPRLRFTTGVSLRALCPYRSRSFRQDGAPHPGLLRVTRGFLRTARRGRTGRASSAAARCGSPSPRGPRP